MSDKLAFGTLSYDPDLIGFSYQTNPIFTQQLNGANFDKYPSYTEILYTFRKSPTILSGNGCKGLPAAEDTTRNPFDRTLLQIKCAEKEVIQPVIIQKLVDDTGTIRAATAGEAGLVVFSNEYVLHRVECFCAVVGQGKLPVITGINDLLATVTRDTHVYNSGRLPMNVTIKALITGDDYDELVTDNTVINIPQGATYECDEGKDLDNFNTWSIKFSWNISTIAEGLTFDSPVKCDATVSADRLKSLLAPNPRDTADADNIWATLFTRLDVLWNTSPRLSYYDLTRSRTYSPNSPMTEDLAVNIMRCQDIFT